MILQRIFLQNTVLPTIEKKTWRFHTAYTNTHFWDSLCESLCFYFSTSRLLVVILKQLHLAFHPVKKKICVTSSTQLSQCELLLPPSGHHTALMTYRSVEVAQLLGRNSTCNLSSALPPLLQPPSLHSPAHWL